MNRVAFERALRAAQLEPALEAALRLANVQDSAAGDSPTYSGLTLTGFSGAVSAAAGVLSAGTLAVANGGTGVTALSNILGTTNQVSVSGGTGRVIGGNVTLSTPQDLHTGATPTFDQLTLTTSLGIGVAASAALDVDGSLEVKRLASAIDVSSADEVIIAVTDTSVPRTVTLQTADITAGTRIFIIKDESGGAAAQNITVATQASETIDGAATATISTNYGALRLYSNGTNLFTF